MIVNVSLQGDNTSQSWPLDKPSNLELNLLGYYLNNETGFTGFMKIFDKIIAKITFMGNR